MIGFKFLDSEGVIDCEDANDSEISKNIKIKIKIRFSKFYFYFFLEG